MADGGRDGEYRRGHHAGHHADPEEKHGGDEVDEHRQRLQEVQDGADNAAHGPAPGGPDPDRHADHSGDDGGHDMFNFERMLLGGAGLGVACSAFEIAATPRRGSFPAAGSAASS